jgi:hypothetical protein
MFNETRQYVWGITEDCKECVGFFLEVIPSYMPEK